MAGGKLPGDDGDRYHPEGYAILEVGPEEKKEKGKEYMSETQARLIGAAPGGCPFADHEQFGEGD
jgi:hypothetical protein